jgi:nuclease HARBI1
MIEALQLPGHIETPSRFTFDPVEALGLTLAQFRTPGDQLELSLLYHRSQSAISEIVNWVVTFVDNSWQQLLDFDHEHLLSPSNLERYTKAIHSRGAPSDTIWGFIDCTIRRIARPSKWQRAAYNGHKKFHALKFQAVMLPNGMIGHLFGPEEGRRNDNFLLAKSGLLDTCAVHAIREGTDENTPAEERFLQVFGDPAYGVSNQIISPYAGFGERTEEERDWNAEMAAVRIEVEHGFGIVQNTWPFLNAGWKMHVYSSPVGRYYRAGVLFTNAINSMRYNQVAQYFDCAPPTLFEYFHD